MSIPRIPNGFSSVTPYFIVKRPSLFSRFIGDAFQAEIIDEHIEEGVFRHGTYRIFESMIEMSEAREPFPSNRISIHLYVPDCETIYQKAIGAGGKSIYPVTDMPYGERSGGIEDPCGNNWWIATQMINMYPGVKSKSER